MPKSVKAVNITVMSEDNKRVMQRFRFKAPNDANGRKRRLIGAGVYQTLENFIDCFDRDNPNHKYRLVALGGARYRLVNAPPDPEPDLQKEHLEKVMTAVERGELPPQTFAPAGA
jgi:hypothetical protein